METIKFMHHHIAESAEFQISFNNEFAPENKGTQRISMDKKDYINSFIHGLNYVSDYKINIETKNINISENGDYAIAEETISEEGIMLNPDEPKAQGVTFKSLTNCKKIYKFVNGVALSDKAECTTATTKTDAV